MSSHVLHVLRVARPLLILAGLITVVSLAAGFGSASLKSTYQIGLIDLIAVIGIYTFVGNSGVFSFGHISFMAIGAYVFALLTIPPAIKGGIIPGAPGPIVNVQMAVLPATVVSMFAAGLFALIIAMALMRLSGLAAGVATFGILVIVNTVIASADNITGGRNTLVGVPTNHGMFATLPWTLMALAAAYAFTVSRWGLRLRASREDEFAARAAGISVTRERTIAFVISGLLCGLAGVAYANALGSISADAF